MKINLIELILNINMEQLSQIEKIYIPFGNDCAIAYQLEKLGLRNTSLPFDWIKSDLEGLIQCIDDDFSYFCDESSFTMKNTSKNFKIIQDNYFDGKLTNSIRMLNSVYDFHHLHDFKLYVELGITQNLKYGFKKFKEKYNKRIIRFRELMRNNLVHKVIVHIGPQKDIELIDKLIEVFDSKSYTNFQIKFISYNEFETLKTSSWKREEYDWASFFI